MKKITICTIIVFLAGIHSPLFSQVSFSLAGGTGISSIPDRPLNTQVSFLSSYGVTNNLDLGFSIGYQDFLPLHTTTAVPLSIEARYKLQSEGIRPYAQMEVGVSRMDFKYYEHTLYPVGVYQFAPDQPTMKQEVSWHSLISLGVGAFFPLTNNVSLDLGLRLGMVSGGAITQRTYVYGSIPQGASGLFPEADSWDYLRLVVGIRTDL
jgi:hypothetical protein